MPILWAIRGKAKGDVTVLCPGSEMSPRRPVFATEYNLPLVSCFFGLLAVAVAMDVARRRIPNLLSIALALTGLGAQLVTHGWRGGVSGIAAGVIIFGLLFWPWSKGGVGGGDLKLAAAAAIWLGWSRLISFILIGSIVGGSVALVCFAFSSPEVRQTMRKNVKYAAMLRAWPDIKAPAAGRISVPYAIAVAAGASCALFLPGGLQWLR
ncbi:MAG: prepilin peptidase [Deltaproteobacteria bacterium]|nr:prepilin peptidase [Deltaproteobacteria bacterium]